MTDKPIEPDEIDRLLSGADCLNDNGYDEKTNTKEDRILSYETSHCPLCQADTLESNVIHENYGDSCAWRKIYTCDRCYNKLEIAIEYCNACKSEQYSFAVLDEAKLSNMNIEYYKKVICLQCRSILQEQSQDEVIIEMKRKYPDNF